MEMAIASTAGSNNTKMQIIRLRTEGGQRIVGEFVYYLNMADSFVL